jgi:hypothetical protein
MRSGPATTRRRHRPTRTFVSLTGPAGNIGDALIRRGTLEWAKGTSDELIVYVGDAPDAWLRQLGVPSGTRVLRSKKSVPRWLWLIATSPSRPALFFEAGEVPLDRGNVLRELVFLAETVVVRLKRGVVVRPPRGIRAPTQPALWLHTRAARLSQVALWRDIISAQLASSSAVAPDIGFAAGVRAGRPIDEREELVLSLRGARPHPGPTWVEAVGAFAAREGLRIRTVVQVREDEQRSRELAEALGGEFDPWGDTDAVIHEERLRELYDRARLVISDRMHVLVLAAESGAVPVEVAPSPTRKISEAFATIGLGGISFDSAGTDREDIEAFLEVQLRRSKEVQDRVRPAEARLAEIEAGVRATIESARS